MPGSFSEALFSSWPHCWQVYHQYGSTSIRGNKRATGTEFPLGRLESHQFTDLDEKLNIRDNRHIIADRCLVIECGACQVPCCISTGRRCYNYYARDGIVMHHLCLAQVILKHFYINPVYCCNR